MFNHGTTRLKTPQDSRHVCDHIAMESDDADPQHDMLYSILIYVW